MADEMIPKAVMEILLQQNATLQNTVKSLQETMATMQSTIEKLTAALEEKNQIILNQNRARFGQRSEKSSYVLSDGQMSMFEITGDGLSEAQTPTEPTTEPEKILVPEHTRKRDKLCADLPVKEVICDLPEEARFIGVGLLSTF